MRNLQSLPAELWLSISSYLGQQSVLTVSLTSKRMHKLVTPELYRQVYYWGSRESEYGGEILRGTQLEYPTKRSATISRSLRSFRIFQPSAFSNSLSRSPWLCSLVHSIDLRWHGSGRHKRLYRLLEALASSPLKHLHLHPPKVGFVLPPSTPITSLCTKWPGNIETGNLDWLHELSLVPSLRHMSLESWDGGRIRTSPTLSLDISPTSLQRASNITHLSFFPCDFPAGFFQAIVTWPRGLRSFSYTERSIVSPQTPTRKQVYSALRLHQNTLEEITLRFLSCEVYEAARERESITSNRFTCLKRLRIQLPDLPPEGDSIWFSRPEIRRKFYASLPPSLEILQIQCWSHDFDSLDEDTSETKTHEFLKQLVKEVDDAKAHLPALKGVGVDGWGLGLMSEFWARAESAEQVVTGTGIKIFNYDPNERESFKRS